MITIALSQLCSWLKAVVFTPCNTRFLSALIGWRWEFAGVKRRDQLAITTITHHLSPNISDIFSPNRKSYLLVSPGESWKTVDPSVNRSEAAGGITPSAGRIKYTAASANCIALHRQLTQRNRLHSFEVVFLALPVEHNTDNTQQGNHIRLGFTSGIWIVTLLQTNKYSLRINRD